MIHGADAFNVRCTQQGKSFGKSAYDFALSNQQSAFAKNKGQKTSNNIENKIIDILISTKQNVFHPKLLNSYNGNKSALSTKGGHR